MYFGCCTYSGVHIIMMCTHSIEILSLQDLFSKVDLIYKFKIILNIPHTIGLVDEIYYLNFSI